MEEDEEAEYKPSIDSQSPEGKAKRRPSVGTGLPPPLPPNPEDYQLEVQSTSTVSELAEPEFNKVVLTAILGLCHSIIFVAGVSVIVIVTHANSIGQTFLTQFDSGNYFGREIIIFTAVAILMIIASILGIFSIFFHGNWLYLLYFGVVILTIIGSLSGSITGFLFTSGVDKYIHKNLWDNMKKYDINKDDDPYTTAYNNLQRELICCGVVQNMKDEQTSAWKSWKIQLPDVFSDKNKIPKSCCRFGEVGIIECQGNPTTENSYVDNDCFNSLNNWLSEHRVFFGGMGLFVVTILPLLLVISYLIMKIFKHWRKFPIGKEYDNRMFDN